MSDRIDAIQALLVEAEQAHAEYEETELNGVYDEDWPQWYAAYAVDHGIAKLMGHAIDTDRLASVLVRGFDEFKQADPEPAEPWSAYLARRIVAEL